MTRFCIFFSCLNHSLDHLQSNICSKMSDLKEIVYLTSERDLILFLFEWHYIATKRVTQKSIKSACLTLEFTLNLYDF